MAEDDKSKQYMGDKQINFLYGTEPKGLYFVFRAHEMVMYGEEDVTLQLFAFSVFERDFN